MKETTLLCILDGWGHREEKKHNAISNANTPNWDRFLAKYPFSLLETSGLAVGLPEGQMGNSEVGHMNIGSGRIIMQMLPRINQAIKDNLLEQDQLLEKFSNDLKKTNGTCHLVGIASDGGVHGHLAHLIHLAKLLAKREIKIALHLFLDGRDTAPKSAEKYLQQLLAEIADYPLIKIATICGRYYAMDRDKKWDRIEPAVKAIKDAQGSKTSDFLAAIQASYSQQINDEFVLPHVENNYQGMQDGDGFLLTNFRADRVRQIIPALLDPNFKEFPSRAISFANQLGFAEYSMETDKYLPCLFPNKTPQNTLADIFAQNNLKQLHIAETEKYAHVTFFFNGGIEQEKNGEKRILIPSPDVATYDLKPEMSASLVKAELIKAINSKQYDFIVVNFANPDMVGHTGIYEAAIQAAETIDQCLGELENSILENNGTMLITADHGNLEEMYNEAEKQPNTAHTLNPVPFLLAGKNSANYQLQNGKLADIAPTILDIMQINQPVEMTGTSLLHKK